MSTSIKHTLYPESCTFVIPITLSVSLLLHPEVEGSLPVCHPQGSKFDSKSDMASTVTSISTPDYQKTETFSQNLDIMPKPHTQDITVRASDEVTLADANSPLATSSNYEYESVVDFLKIGFWASWFVTFQEKILRFFRSVLKHVCHAG